jgi:predicted  nucleic acid-binding Zn-ribbon protein
MATPEETPEVKAAQKKLEEAQAELDKAKKALPETKSPTLAQEERVEEAEEEVAEARQRLKSAVKEAMDEWWAEHEEKTRIREQETPAPTELPPRNREEETIERVEHDQRPQQPSKWWSDK